MPCTRISPGLLRHTLRTSDSCTSCFYSYKYQDAHAPSKFKCKNKVDRAPVLNPSLTANPRVFARLESSSADTIDKTTAEKLKATYKESKNVSVKKVTVVGSGEVAVTLAFALLSTGTTKDVCMLGYDKSKSLKGEQLDIAQASVFLKDPRIVATNDHADSRNSEICVITTGTEQGRNEDNYEFTARNTGVVRAVVPELMKYSPDAVYLMAGDPVDVLTREAWLAGGMHQSRVLGTGTNLHSAMLRSLMASRMGVHTSTCHGMVVGQNNPCGNPPGSGGVPIWSAAMVKGIRLSELNAEIGSESDPEKWQDHYEAMIQDEQFVRRLKGGYYWASAMSIVDICQAILTNSQSIRPVSTYALGRHNIVEDVFLSLPCILGAGGVVSIVKHPLTAKESFLLRRDARKVAESQAHLGIMQA